MNYTETDFTAPVTYQTYLELSIELERLNVDTKVALRTSQP